MQKRVLAVHDISCVGKCSLTVALPILSAIGVETSVLPTAVLSTHTGGFSGFTYRDLTCDFQPIVDHWKSLNLKFDSIYTGYLGSFEQLALVTKLFDDFRTEQSLFAVDPVMADNGKLYSSFTPEFVKGMAALCSKADLIIPNITEATLMLGREYLAPPYTREYIGNLLFALSKLGPKMIVLTGVSFDDTTIGAAVYDAQADEFTYSSVERIDGYYHGTGDIFASAMIGGILNGKSLGQSAEIAVSFTADCIRRTFEAGTEVRYGVNFEQALPGLIRMMNR